VSVLPCRAIWSRTHWTTVSGVMPKWVCSAFSGADAHNDRRTGDQMTGAELAAEAVRLRQAGLVDVVVADLLTSAQFMRLPFSSVGIIDC
jgi:hypothetical protein